MYNKNVILFISYVVKWGFLLVIYLFEVDYCVSLLTHTHITIFILLRDLPSPRLDTGRNRIWGLVRLIFH